MNNRPPKWPLRFFRWFCRPEYLEDIEGDLLERFEKNISEEKPAKFKFTLDVLRLCRPGISKSIKLIPKMSVIRNFKHYSLISWRLFSQNKLISAFSLLCLIVGAVSATLMFSWVQNETSMDNFHHSKDNIYFLMMKPEPVSKTRFMPSFLGSELSKEYPEVNAELSIQAYDLADDALIETEGRSQSINLWVTGKEFFDVFDFPLLYGNRSGILEDPRNIVISRKLAENLFKNEYPIGKYLTLHCQEVGSYQVSGVIDDIPSNSSLNFDAIIPNHNSDIFWARSGSKLIVVNDQFDQKSFDEKIIHLARSHEQFQTSEVFTLPFSGMYFGQSFHNNLFSRHGDKKAVRNMILISIVILALCLFGFTNLQHIQQLSSSKSLAVRYINGARQIDLFHEILIGRFYLSLIGTLISLLILGALFPQFATLVDVPLRMDWVHTLGIVAIIIATIIGFSMIVTFSHLLKFRLVDAFKKTFFQGSKPLLQRSITVVQYTVTIILLTVTLIAYLQYDHMMSKDLGFDPHNVIQVKLVNEMLMDQSKPIEQLKTEYQQKQDNYQYALNELRNHSAIASVSQGEKPANGQAYPMEMKKSDDLEYQTLNMITVDPSYLDLLGLDLVSGRFFHDSLDQSRGSKVIINETARKHWNIDDIDGVKIQNKYWGEFEVIGVVKDFNYESAANSIEPLIMYYMVDMESPFLIKMQAGRELDALTYIEEEHAKLSPNHWFGYTYLEDEIKAQYESERLLFKVYWIFTLVAVILSFTNLYAFAWSETQRRIKEMGIRKVHGATPAQLFLKLGFSFWKLVLLSFILASPIAGIMMAKWLIDYSYRITMEPWHFLLGGLVTFIISFFAVANQSWLVAKTNPVTILRNE